MALTYTHHNTSTMMVDKCRTKLLLQQLPLLFGPSMNQDKASLQRVALRKVMNVMSLIRILQQFPLMPGIELLYLTYNLKLIHFLVTYIILILHIFCSACCMYTCLCNRVSFKIGCSSDSFFNINLFFSGYLLSCFSAYEQNQGMLLINCFHFLFIIFCIIRMD